jgi:hypothetical protein
VERKRDGISYLDILDGKYTPVTQQTSAISLPQLVSPVKPQKRFSFSEYATKPAISKNIFYTSFDVKPNKIRPDGHLNSLIGNSTPSLSITEEQKYDNSNLTFSFQKPPSPLNLVISQSPIQSNNVKIRTLPDSKRKVGSNSFSPNKTTFVDNVKTKEQQRQHLLSSISNQILLELMDAEIKQTIYSVFVESKKRKSKLETHSEEIFEAITNSIIREIIIDRMEALTEISIWRSALNDIFFSLVDEEIVFRCSCWISEEMSLKLNYRRIYIRILQHWIFRVELRRFTRKKKEVLGKRMISFIRESSLRTTLDYKAQAGTELIVDDQLENRLAKMSQEMAETRATWYKSLDYQCELAPLLQRNSNCFYKVIILSAMENSIPGTLSWFTENWLISKLSCGTLNSDKFIDTIHDVRLIGNDGQNIRLFLQKIHSKLYDIQNNPVIHF